MKIALLIPTRGRPDILRETVEVTSRQCSLDETKIVVGFDGDDNSIMFDDPRVVHSIAPREDTMGAKFNRLYSHCAGADLYVLGGDDCHILTFGWDKTLADVATTTFTDGIGFIYFGKTSVPAIFPGCYVAVSQRLIKLMGKLAPEYFPFWWIDAWLFEIAILIDRIASIDRIRVEPVHHDKQSRGVREVEFWAELFDQKRPEREDIATKIVRSQWFDHALSMKLRIFDMYNGWRSTPRPISHKEYLQSFGLDG